jgi:hypothetical protein
MLLLLAALALLPVGCGTPKPKPRPWNVSISKQTPASIEVDLIGITEMERPGWEGYDIDKYWKSGDLRRANADKLSANLPTGTPWTVSREDPKWQGWMRRGATELLLIANLPGHFAPGPSDPRRVFIPLDKNAWRAQDKTLQIDVQDDSVRMMTPPRLRK